jgi:cellobiose phosphorylase
MNLAGIRGRGESIWLGWFLYEVLTQFSEVERLQGGWSWYTGSAGRMYRLILESLLGLRLEVRLPAGPRT